MMDAHDTNLPLNQGELEEEKKTVEVSEAITETPTEEGTEKVTEEVTAEVQTEAAPKPATKEDVLNRLKELAQDSENANKQEIDNLKQSFYKLHNAELEAAKKQFIDNGGAAEDFTPQDDPTEEEFKRLMGSIKEKRSQLVAEQERQKEENLQVKLSIIEELKELVESGDDANKSYTEFKKLQQQWNETKLVPQGKVNELWKNYQLYVEKFYDLLKLNNEFREYDFKKNLEIKTHLCEAAEKLADEEDVVSAFHQLQKLHQEFRDTGPVAKELRDEIWNRFKAASTAVNRRHQQHFEALKESEQHNLDQKTVICEIVEAIEIYLQQEGYHVLKAYDGEQALDMLKKNEVHLLIIDVMMPKLDGIRATLKIREESSIPIIILSAKSEDSDKILGLNIGADDYVTKPFNPLELVARVKSQLRRYTQLGNVSESNETVYQVGGLMINDDLKEVTVDGELVKLTPIEYNILLLLVKNQGKVFSIEQIYENIWNEDAIGADNTVAVHIRHIREKIEINPKEPRYLKVVWGVGYKVEKN